ncbi:MAG: hypothetical protein Ta2A_25170 [Treponemataceae bacterium]|nr:MAG: hypothetical protein Ta2A_25170 [Treponemataceae bacterium]
MEEFLPRKSAKGTSVCCEFSLRENIAMLGVAARPCAAGGLSFRSYAVPVAFSRAGCYATTARSLRKY